MGKKDKVYGPHSNVDVTEEKHALDMTQSHNTVYPFKKNSSSDSFKIVNGKRSIVLPYDVILVDSEWLIEKKWKARLCSPDVVLMDMGATHGIVRPIDFKHKNNSFNTKQINASNFASLITHSPYLTQAIEFVADEYNIDRKNITIDNGKIIYFEQRTKRPNEYINHLLNESAFRELFGLEKLTKLEIEKMVCNVHEIKAEGDIETEIKKVVGAVKKKGYAAYSTMYVDSSSSSQNPDVLFEYAQAHHVVDNINIGGEDIHMLNERIEEFDKSCLYKARPLDGIPMRLFVKTDNNTTFQVLLRREELTRSKQEYAQKD